MNLSETIQYNWKKILIGVLVILGAILLFFVLISNIKSPSLKVKEKILSLYVAKTDKDKQIGLSKYKSISNEKGMIFIFDKPDYYPFWMKGMKFPIDIIYIKDNKVITVLKDLRAESSDSVIYYPTAPANKVLEINAGLSTQYNITPGDTVQTKNF